MQVKLVLNSIKWQQVYLNKIMPGLVKFLDADYFVNPNEHAILLIMESGKFVLFSFDKFF